MTDQEKRTVLFAKILNGDRNAVLELAALYAKTGMPTFSDAVLSALKNGDWESLRTHARFDSTPATVTAEPKRFEVCAAVEDEAGGSDGCYDIVENIGDEGATVDELLKLLRDVLEDDGPWLSNAQGKVTLRLGVTRK